MKTKGYVLQEDSQRVVIATGFDRPSNNIKTGPMIQVWILVRHLNPVDAVHTGSDRLVCGNCPLRGDHGKGRACYVLLHQAPLNIWRQYQAGGYSSDVDWQRFKNRSVRFGAYGDPVHIKLPLVEKIMGLASGWTGYTHQWRDPKYAEYRRIFMASVEDIGSQCDAVAAGWRTFRVKREWQPSLSDEVTCPSVTHGTQCINCQLCRGSSIKAKSIVIDIHGSTGINKNAVN